MLQLAGGSALGMSLGLAGCSSGSVTGRLLESKAPLPEQFVVPLPVPPVSTGRRRDGATHHELTLKAATVEILPGLKTRIWGYDGRFPGPTISSRSGRRTVVTHVNKLPVPIVTHLHGGRTPPEDDGYPIDLVVPDGFRGNSHANHGGTVSRGRKSYDYPLQQRASTLWYHDHRMDFTGPQVWRGLAGFHLVHDDVDDALPLPKGERDVPLMICDRSFDADGSLLYPSVDSSLLGEHGVDNDFHEGVLGDVILVNGAPWPVMEVVAARYRLRFLNASNARRYELALDPPPPEGPHFTQVASDGGLLAAPVTMDTLPVAQAERYEVVVDFAKYRPGTEVTLVNRAADGKQGQVMRFRVTRRVRDDSRVPGKLSDLSDYDALDPAKAAVTRKISFGRGGEQNGHEVWVVNGKLFTPDHSVANPRLGTTEVWEFSVDAHHPVHVHLVHFKILSRSGNENTGLRPQDKGWKDTIDLRPGENARVIARFGPYRGKYVMHCHNLEHEDMAMMANFVVK